MLAGLPAPGPQDHLGQHRRRVRGPQIQTAAVGRGTARVVHRDAHLCAVRFHLGRQPAHRQRPRPRAAGQPGALLHPGRLVPALRCGLRSDRAAVRETRPVRGSDHQGLVRTGQRFPDGRLRPLRIDRLPARRRLAPHLRPGRHAVGTDPPDDDRRCRVRDDLCAAPRIRGRPGDGRRQAARRRLPQGHQISRLRRHHHRPFGVPDRVRLRRAAVPPGVRADADRGGGGVRSRRGPNNARPWRRDTGRAVRDRAARPRRADSRPCVRRADQLVRAVPRCGRRDRTARSHPGLQAADRLRPRRRPSGQHRRAMAGVVLDRRGLSLPVAVEHLARGTA